MSATPASEPTPEQDLAERVKTALSVVIDPELGQNIIDLGLVYDVSVEAGGIVLITMTTTTRGCPATNYLKEAAHTAAWHVPGAEFVEVSLTYDPPWDVQMMTPATKAIFGIPDLTA